LAHHKSPKVTAPEAKKLEPKISKAKAEPKHEYFEEEDWL
jgi:hypothetical protein